MSEPRFGQSMLEFVTELKRNAPCKDCGKNFDPVCMDFDHLPGTQKVGHIARMVGRASKEAIIAEISKCDIVCACCHRLRTSRRVVGLKTNGSPFLVSWDYSLDLERDLASPDFTPE